MDEKVESLAFGRPSKSKFQVNLRIKKINGSFGTVLSLEKVKIQKK